MSKIGLGLHAQPFTLPVGLLGIMIDIPFSDTVKAFNVQLRLSRELLLTTLWFKCGTIAEHTTDIYASQMKYGQLGPHYQTTGISRDYGYMCIQCS